MTTVSIASGIRHTAILTRRNILRVTRLPQLIFFTAVQPVMFLVLFNYVFGGALSFGGPISEAGGYINWLIPGILLQSVVFGASATAIGLTDDMAKGVIDRFRSLPMSRSAVLAARTLADVTRMAFVTLLMLGVGTLMGWEYQHGFWRMTLGWTLALGFGYVMTWVMATIGLAVKDPETAQIAGFLPLFPLVFASSVFVPTQTMPSWLQAFAEVQPITVVTNAIRGLMLTGETGDYIWQSLLWIFGLLAIFAPLAVRMYKRAID